MLWPGKHVEEMPEHHLKAVLRLLRRQVWNGRLFPYNELHLGDKTDDHLAVWTDRLSQGRTPLVHFRFVLDENLTDQRPEGLCQGRVRDVALVLVELARREKPALRDKRLVQLVHHRRFADAGITGYEHELWRTLSNDPVEARNQGIDLALPPVQLLRDQQSV